MKQRVLIPCYFLAGHHLEYLKNFYHYAFCDDDKNHEYVFILSPSFEEPFRKLPNKENIKVVFLSSEDVKGLNHVRHKTDLQRNLLTRKLVKKFRATDVLYLAFSYSFSTLSFLTVNGVNYSGILFTVYPYTYSEMSIKEKLLTVIPHWLNVKNNCIKNIFISNDITGAIYLNRLYNTNKFKYVPDPFVPIKMNFNEDLVLGNDKSLMKGKIVLFHFGAIRKSKGTSEILKAIKCTPRNICGKLCFVIAGRVPSPMHEEIYKLVKECSELTTIIFHDDFCSYEYIAAVCKRSSYILMPYSHTSSSSGMYGYAAQFGVPVVASDKNMTRKIVRRFHLGILLKDISSKGLSDFYRSISVREKYNVSKEYLLTNSVDSFNYSIFNSIFKS